MDPHITNDQGLNVPQPQPGGAATMPLPPSASVQPPAASPWHAVGSAAQTPPGFAVPQPDYGQAPAVPASVAGPNPNVLPTTVPVYVPGADTGTGQALAGGSQPQGAAALSGAAATPAEAADTDVIEKEWIIRAKEVVAATRHDPYGQVRELNKLKADYMKKRYNKELKLPDA